MKFVLMHATRLQSHGALSVRYRALNSLLPTGEIGEMHLRLYSDMLQSIESWQPGVIIVHAGGAVWGKRTGLDGRPAEKKKSSIIHDIVCQQAS